MASPLSGELQAPVTDLAGSSPPGAWAADFPATVAALFSGLKWGSAIGSGATITYSFPGAGAKWSLDYSGLNEPASSVAFSSDQAAAARLALASWAAVGNMAFQEVPDTASDVGLIRFSGTNVTFGAATGWAYSPSDYWASGGDVWLAQATVSGYAGSDWLPGGQGYSVLLHEIGHSLGLKHPSVSSASAPVTLPVSEDTQQYTVMSYTFHPHDLFRTVTPDGLGGYVVDVRPVEPDTPMIDDIMAIQYLYGANMAYHSGNDTYTFNPAAPFFRTIWDGGGTDTISVANFGDDCIISLVPGTFSKITILSDALPVGYSFSGTPPPEPTYDGTDNLGIAFDCWIENAIGGAGNDALIGNQANNVLDGGAGFDTARYSGIQSGYSVTKSAGYGYTVTDTDLSNGNDGTDTLFAIEHLQFAGATINLPGRSLERVATPAVWVVIDNTHNAVGDSTNDLWWKQINGSAIWVMDGTDVSAPHVIAPNTGWSVVNTNDYNTDGKADMAWHNADGRDMQWINAVDLAAAQGIAPDAGWPLN